jgi:hypothetical protein
MKEQTGGHPAWMSYFTVESADDTASKARSLGGRLLDEPFDVMDAGRMAVVQDPTGAVFAVWEPRNSIGSEVFGEPGALAWAELYTRDTGAATQFYTELFGWAVNKHPGADGREYTEYHIEDRSAAGMLEIRKEWGEMPAHWAVYLAVADLDATLAQAKGMGATEVMPPMEVEGVGRFVFVQDPQGAYVALMQISASRISGAAS